jgi:dynein heavy chain 1
VANTGGDQSQGAAGGLDGILKGLNFLKVHLSQARQNMEIPMVELTVDPEVKVKFEQASKNGTYVQLSDFDDRV